MSLSASTVESERLTNVTVADDTEAMLQEQNVKADHMWLFSLKLALDVTRDIGMRGPSLDKIFCTNAERLAS